MDRNSGVGRYTCVDCGYDSGLIPMRPNTVFVHSCLLRAQRIFDESEAELKNWTPDWKSLEPRRDR